MEQSTKPKDGVRDKWPDKFVFIKMEDEGPIIYSDGLTFEDTIDLLSSAINWYVSRIRNGEKSDMEHDVPDMSMFR